jgi:hypothetical protein
VQLAVDVLARAGYSKVGAAEEGRMEAPCPRTWRLWLKAWIYSVKTRLYQYPTRSHSQSKAQLRKTSLISRIRFKSEEDGSSISLLT